jgi:hypothetical protein
MPLGSGSSVTVTSRPSSATPATIALVRLNPMAGSSAVSTYVPANAPEDGQRRDRAQREHDPPGQVRAQAGLEQADGGQGPDHQAGALHREAPG